MSFARALVGFVKIYSDQCAGLYGEAQTKEMVILCGEERRFMTHARTTCVGSADGYSSHSSLDNREEMPRKETPMTPFQNRQEEL